MYPPYWVSSKEGTFHILHGLFIMIVWGLNNPVIGLYTYCGQSFEPLCGLVINNPVV